MKAWLVRGVIFGLGKGDVLVVPREDGNSLSISRRRSDDHVWQEKVEGQVTADDDLGYSKEQIEVPAELTQVIESGFTNGIPDQPTKELFSNFIIDSSQR